MNHETGLPRLFSAVLSFHYMLLDLVVENIVASPCVKIKILHVRFRYRFWVFTPFNLQYSTQKRGFPSFFQKEDKLSWPFRLSGSDKINGVLLIYPLLFEFFRLRTCAARNLVYQSAIRLLEFCAVSFNSNQGVRPTYSHTACEYLKICCDVRNICLVAPARCVSQSFNFLFFQWAVVTLGRRGFQAAFIEQH